MNPNAIVSSSHSTLLNVSNLASGAQSQKTL
jgi:hypothetical protein